MSKAFLIGIVIFLLGCSAGSLSVDATDYASLCKQAEQEGKNVVVLVTAADCPVCHGLLREWTGCGNGPNGRGNMCCYVIRHFRIQRTYFPVY